MSPHLSRVALSTALLCIYFGCLQLGGAHAEIRTRSRAANAAQRITTNDAEAAVEVVDDVGDALNGGHDGDDDAGKENMQPLPAEKIASAAANVVNSDLIDKFSWKCANNASCLYSLANGLVQAYKRGETIKLGLFDLVKLPPRATNDKNKPQWDSSETGRSMATFVDFISGNAIRIPIGPMVFSVQRAEDDSNYIEVALLKKAVNQGRRGDDGFFGGGGGGGLGGGGGSGGLRNRRNHDKKQFQMYIPMYLAATTFGWTLVAAKAVGLLTLKALIISKVAFVVAAMVLIKKFMDTAHDKMMYQFPEHTPYMMPYGMDYPIHALGGGEIATNDMYPAALHLAAAAPLAHHGHPGVESLGAESNLHHNLADVHNNTQVLAALNAVGLGQKVKREDTWMAKGTLKKPEPLRKPFYWLKRNTILKEPKWVKASELKNDVAMALAAAASVAEDQSNETDDYGEEEEDDIFNEEENVKDTLNFLGLTIRKKKK